MSYKFSLDRLDRDSDVSLTQQIVDRVAAAIDAGGLAPGERLPTTRALAEGAGVNHLTASRAYRRLAELGYVTATVGRGTFVRTLPPAAAERDGDAWQHSVLPDRPWAHRQQALDDAFRLASARGLISLATGWPAPECVPVQALAEAAAAAFAELGQGAVGYSDPAGVSSLREQLALRGREAGYASGPEEIVVTTGARQAIDLAARAVLSPGDVAVVESPTFVGTLSSLLGTGARVIGIPVDEDGPDVDAFERILAREEVRLLALQTACQNPTGRDLSPERAERIARLAVQRNVFVVEDGVYAGVRYEGTPRRRLRHLAPSHVIYVDSLSKCLDGGLRIGWAAAGGPVRDRIASLKLDTDLHSPTLTQETAARYLATGEHEARQEQVSAFYRERRDALLESLERRLGDECRWVHPLGGHNVWITLNRPLDDRALYAEALRHGVSFTPGSAVMAEPPAETSLRLSFSLIPPEDLDEGVRRLAQAIRAERRRMRPPALVAIS